MISLICVKRRRNQCKEFDLYEDEVSAMSSICMKTKSVQWVRFVWRRSQCNEFDLYEDEVSAMTSISMKTKLVQWVRSLWRRSQCNEFDLYEDEVSAMSSICIKWRTGQSTHKYQTSNSQCVSVYSIIRDRWPGFGPSYMYLYVSSSTIRW